MNPFNRPNDYTYSMNMNFPSLNQANPSANFQGNLGQNMNLQKGGNMPTHPSQDSYVQNQKYLMNATALQRQSLASKGLSSQSNAFVPSSYGSTSGFLANNQASAQQQQHSSFNYPPPGFSNQKAVPQQLGHPQYPPNIYPQGQGQQQYMQGGSQGFQQHPGVHQMGGSNFFPQHQMASSNTSFNSGLSTEYSENDREFDKVVEHIANLKYPEKREEALGELSKKRESFQQLALYLWHSVGTLAILLQEIVAIYPLLSPQTLSQPVSYKVCNVLGLLQCLALHQDTRALFLNAHIPLFLYPFLNTSSKSKPFENLRVTSLGVIGALVKGDDSDAINFLMQTEIIPLCLRIMKRGQELSRTVATFIVQKILLDDNGLAYICQTGERFFAVSTVLHHMVTDLTNAGKDDQRLLRHIIRCYLRLAENPKANEALRKYLPGPLRELDQKLITDDAVRKWHAQLLQTLELFEPEQ